MELRQLKYFVATAKTMNFTEAAKECNITQSTLSQQISSLEGEIGAKLFDRNKHSVSLTDMGEALLPYAIKTLNEAAECFERMRDVKNLDDGEINIGTTYTFLPLIKETVLDFMKSYPNIKLNIICKTMTELIELLRQRKIDVALTHKPTEITEGIESHVLFDSELCVVMGKRHPLADKDSLTLRDLEPYPVCLPAKGLQARQTLDSVLENNGEANLDVRLEINDVNILIGLVEKSSMLTFLSKASVLGNSDVKTVSLKVPGVDLQGSFQIVKGSYVKYSTRAFLKLLCEKNKVYFLSMMPFMYEI